MDFGTLLFLGFLWFLFNLLRKGGVAGSAPRTPPQPPPPSYPRSRQASLPESVLEPVRPGADATQREGGLLETLLRDLNRNLEEAAQTARTKAGAAARAEAERDQDATGDEFEEERESLEVAPETVSLETAPPRAPRAVVDQDDLAGQVLARRIKAAEVRNAAQTPADHRRFDERIRQEPADHTAVVTAVAAKTYPPTPEQLRNAIVWRELLGPPVALRDDESILPSRPAPR